MTTTQTARPESRDGAPMPYRDATLSVEARVADLLGRMSLDEKLAQLGSCWSFELLGQGPTLDPGRASALLGQGMGQVTRIAGATNLAPDQVALAGNEIQRYLVEETRLGIPALFHEESLHGLLARDATSFQQSIGAAAAWDPELVEAMATSIRRRMLATGARLALAPVLDITRDPRWGRVEETYGEDPYLAAELGCAYIRGLQGSSLGEGVMATGKHLVGHGLAEGGLNTAPVHIGPRELRDEQLFPFEAAVRDAGLASMMPAYCDVDGLPCHASGALLTGILRDEWGFDGVVVSDYLAIPMLSTHHRLSPDLADAAALALGAGVDAELPQVEAFGSHLREALADGRLEEAAVDAAVTRILRQKVAIGLFERPFVEPPSKAVLADLRAEERLLARRLAGRSIVLLENRNVLPLRPDVSRVAVIGPIADSARDLMGDYDHLLHLESQAEARREAVVDRARPGPIGASDAITDSAVKLAGRRTVLEAITAALPGASIAHARGTGIAGGSDAEIGEAVAAAGSAEIAILVLGERSGLTDDATTGEFRDRRDLGLHGRQQELLEAVVATGTPVVLVVVSGRPLTLGWAADHCAAVLLAWVPGEAGPDAIADVLVGRANPGGKLPISMPRHVGQLPISYRHHPTGGRSHPKGDYVDGPTTPLWPFGFGRSYTSFELSNLRVEATTVPTTGGEIDVMVDVVNTGDRAGDEVVQLYARDEVASVARPVRELRGFRRLSLDPGERRTVGFRLSVEQFAYVGADLRRVIEPGVIHLAVGTSSDDLPLAVDVELVGPTLALIERTRYLTITRVT